MLINAAFWLHFGHGSASRQAVVPTCLPQSRKSCAADVRGSNIRHCAFPFFKLFFGLSDANLVPFPFSSIKASAARRFHCNKAATSWTGGLSGGQGSSLQHYQHQRHLRHHSQSGLTRYGCSPANIAVSTSVNQHFITASWREETPVKGGEPHGPVPQERVDRRGGGFHA